MEPGTIRVAIIDDNRDMRHSLKTAIEAAGGFKVVGLAGSGSEGIALIKKKAVQVVLLDFELPEGEALQAARLIKQVNPQVIIIALCVFSDASLSQAAQKVGVSLLVEKVYPASVFVHQIQELLDRGGDVLTNSNIN